MARAPEGGALRIPGGAGAELDLDLDRPAGASRGIVLVAHAFGSSKDLRSTRRLARHLAEHGWTAARFDFTGLGASAGDFAETTLTSNVDDVLAVVEHLRRTDAAPVALVGHSLGGAAVLLAASRVPEARVVATIAAPSDTASLRDKLLARGPDVLSSGRAVVEAAGKTVEIGRALIEDLPRHDLRAAAAALGKPLAIFHSPRDRTVGPRHAARLFRAARHPKSFVSLDDADHLMLDDAAAPRLVAGVLAALLERWAGAEPPGPRGGGGV